ncbi:methyl-accepting chemotaxis protein [Ensifer soli]|uniref:methyl-accepting chemotaxis protein n=1 Tax=Ciceribacter sp. sgz301302 TaxID=3342379 RepID=UPI0035B86813
MSNADSKTRQLNDRLQFVDMGEAQRAALSRNQPVVAAAIGPALDAFYAKVKATPETARFFSSDGHVQGAKSRQAKHWETIASGSFDSGYVDSVTTIGRTHARIGLEPRWYIGGYALVLENLARAVIEKHLEGFLYRGKAQAISTDVGAVVKAALVDMDYAITVYLDALKEERDRVAEERNALQRQQEQALSAVEAALKRLATGDLTSTIDETLAPEFQGLKANFNSAIRMLDQALGSIVSAAEETASNSGELVSATDDMAKRTEQQAAALEETAAALEEITTISKQAAARTEEARGIVRTATEEAKKSGEVVEEAVKAMSAIEDSSRKITQIIGVIDQISFQTNLLALNAGVEAARAGDAGKGFAVVAQEVRELAQKSASAAKEIKSLIDQSFEDVVRGVSLVNRTGEALHQIGDQVVHINDHIASIAGSAREQSAGITEINAAVTSMDQVTQRNAAMVEEANAATHSLMRVSTTLKDLVARFRVSGGAGASGHERQWRRSA